MRPAPLNLAGATWVAQGSAKWVTIQAPPIPWQRARPRARTGIPFTPKPVARQQAEWRMAWMDQNGPAQMTHEAIAIVMAKFVVARPPSHWNKKGELNANGRRRLVPPRGDVDNLLKLALDALNDVAYKDDVAIVRVDGLEKVYTTAPDQLPGALLGFSKAVLL